MRQISFAAVCDHGHMQDFPWREWVHREKNPSCRGPLTYHAGGTGSLDDIVIRCGCGKSRNLTGVMGGDTPDPDNADKDKKEGWSFLSSHLLATGARSEPVAEKAPAFFCQGGRPWFGEAAGAECSRPLRAVLINATNVHYAAVQSALWIPATEENDRVKALRQVLDEAAIRGQVSLLRSMHVDTSAITDSLLKRFSQELGDYDKDLVVQCLEPTPVPLAGGSIGVEEGGHGEHDLRWPEYLTLRKGFKPSRTDEPLEARCVDTDRLPQSIKRFVDVLVQVDRLRETRVMDGFTRLVPTPIPGAPPRSSHLWRNPPAPDYKWYPATQVFGEGIFFTLNEDLLQSWEGRDDVRRHLRPLQKRELAAARRASRPARAIEPRFILLHTLAHLLMRSLCFECGYGSASLRERLYVSTSRETPMAGLLIYTAAGDCEGSMGGLVRMGEAALFARIAEAALEEARWCTADPVCSESGLQGGQGIDGLNIAACHCCALVPETSCEYFNCYLDRHCLTAGTASGGIGFFDA